ncbi:hypothetical protein BC834DRAFT_973256 [Gloeopeniophorella convolvens]|nr:hypothetical protein BC834DRAFT_973256 [Gloeopeniophorella convolvens]
MTSPEPTSSDSTDIFSLSDRVLAEKLQFVQEIGFGNWGSVWLCKPKVSDGVDDTKLAVKLVHRSKTTTTAARVRSLWNEMKVVRTFKNDPHPSIVPFHSFIITPSYALITMDYLPTLVPVEVPERKAKEWFRSLLSGVEFLHARGVVHNDIKPANILLSDKEVPVLVDFGFAEKYEQHSSKAFRSNLTYGTPEYLSPERARGLPHDTRKADIWSLGITFFEILVGRTPFEHTEGEPFTTKAALEDYWGRTMRGKWLGTWKMSKGVEKMLHRMIQPNADLRCNAPDALLDPYWETPLPEPGNKKASNSTTSDSPKLRDIISPWSPRQPSKGQQLERGRPERKREGKENAPAAVATPKKEGARQRVLSGTDVFGLTKKRPNVNSRTFTPTSSKENMTPAKPRTPKSEDKENASPSPKLTLCKQVSTRGITRKPSALGDRTLQARNTENSRAGAAEKSVNESDKSMGSVRDRMREWELERARLREMERVGESDAHDTDQEAERPAPRRKPSRIRDLKAPPTSLSPFAHSSPTSDQFARNTAARICRPAKDSSMPIAPISPISPVVEAESPTRAQSSQNVAANDSSLNLLKQSLKVSLGKTVDMYKSSVGFIGRRVSTNNNSTSPQELSERPSWEKEVMQAANSSLPTVQQSLRNRRVGADNRADRMTIWLQNVEKVVADARQNFASSNISLLPPLPVAPGPQTRRPSRDPAYGSSNRSARIPRKPLAASHIFQLEADLNADQSFLTAAAAAQNDPQGSATQNALPANPSDPEPSRSAFSFDSPRPTRRATILGRSPDKSRSLDIDMSPSKRREKSKSANDLQRLIRPISKVQLELDRLAVAAKTSRSTMLDASLFMPDPVPTSDPDAPESSNGHGLVERSSRDSLTSSPFVVQPYPARKGTPGPVIDSPTQRHVEGVYDRFLMATSGVKRVGKGYQSSSIKPISCGPPSQASPGSKGTGRFFHTTRRPMPPPVSSEDKFLALSTDELGVMQSSSEGSDAAGLREDRARAAKTVGRALKALVTGKTVSRKSSRLH